ncbi:MAG: MarR family transcriptional regulator [Hespellia sp.]|nr:MarR family transcriptional regulator [Hespellia sp.]
MSTDKIVEKVRAFNRFYMPSMNLLGNHYLGSEYSVTESRVFFELYENEGCNAAHIAQIMNIDKSYLSRIIKSHEKNGYIKRSPSRDDGRSYSLFLTDKGMKKAVDFIYKSDVEIGSILQNLSKDEQIRLVDALDTITELLSKGKGGVQR